MGDRLLRCFSMRPLRPPIGCIPFVRRIANDREKPAGRIENGKENAAVSYPPQLMTGQNAAIRQETDAGSNQPVLIINLFRRIRANEEWNRPFRRTVSCGEINPNPQTCEDESDENRHPELPPHEVIEAAQAPLLSAR